ncbi:MAG: sulfatase-like hydrolase/transferase [Rhizobiales bacterium]|nr:sulfatase-like hydrolase/transferase [Hyphomicrobiales bacterium]
MSKPVQAADTRPNFVILLIDDAALMDLGAYGGEAHTPNIDALAAKGVQFTHYRTSPLCAPSRAMLLTGIDNHKTGVATIPEVIPPEQEGKPGYSLSLEPGVETLADRLRPAGYRTLMTGKWHMGSKKGDLPVSHGFEHSFALDASGADNWEQKSYMPFYEEAPWFEDDKPATLPKDFYSSKFIIDKMIDYIDHADSGTAKKDAPFFAYLAFQAIHIPVQAPPEFTAHYDGVYDAGWQVLREKRWARAKELGLIPMDAPLEPMLPGMRKWEDLSPADQKLYAARMQVNAAMLEAMDFHIGRLIAHLRETGQYDNTVFIVTSDNGPEPTRGDDDKRLALWMALHGYHTGLENIGEKGSWGFIGPEWANAAASPSALYKFYASEGGLRVPLIMAGPGIPSAGVVNSRALVTDLAPTILQMADVGADDLAGAMPMTGRSLEPVLTGQRDQVYGPDDLIGVEVSGNAALYKGDYKIVRNVAPVGDGIWRLFNIAVDPGETNDLSASEPERFAELKADYATYAKNMGVLEMPEGYNSRVQIDINTMAKQRAVYGWMLLPFIAGVIVLIGGIWWFIRRRRRAA